MTSRPPICAILTALLLAVVMPLRSDAVEAVDTIVTPRPPKAPAAAVIHGEPADVPRAVVVQSESGKVLRLKRDSIYAREISIDVSGIRIVDRNGLQIVLPAHPRLPSGIPDIPDASDFDIVIVDGDTMHVAGRDITIYGGGEYDQHDQMTQLASDIEIREDETVRGDVICIFCDIDVKGTVTGSAVSVFGNVSIDGEAGNEAVAPFGRVRVGPDGHVRGDVSASKIVRDPGGRIDGTRNELFINIFGGDDGLNEAWTRTTFTIIVSLKILFWLFLVLLGHALAARNITKVKERIQRSYAKSFFMGILGQLLLLPVFLLLLITIIGIPVALFVLPLMIFGGFVLAQAAVGQLVGEKISENTSLPLRTPLAKTIGGVAALQIFAYLTIIFIWPAGHGSSGGAFRLVTLIMFILSAIVGYVVLTLGTGAVLLTRFGTRPKEAMTATETTSPTGPIAADGVVVTPLPFEPRRKNGPDVEPAPNS